MTFEELMDSTPPMQQHALVKGYQAGFAAGAANRDADVVSLTNQRDYEYVRAENAEQERDQLREQIASLKDELRQISTAIDDVRLDLTNTAAELIMAMKEQLASRDAEVAKLKDDNEYLYVAAIERDQLREQVKMLREFVKLLRDYIPASAVGCITVQEAIASTKHYDRS